MLWAASVNGPGAPIVSPVLIPFSNTRGITYKSKCLASAWCAGGCGPGGLRWERVGRWVGGARLLSSVAFSELPRGFDSVARGQIQLSAVFRCCGWYGNLLCVCQIRSCFQIALTAITSDLLIGAFQKVEIWNNLLTVP